VQELSESSTRLLCWVSNGGIVRTSCETLMVLFAIVMVMIFQVKTYIQIKVHIIGGYQSGKTGNRSYQSGPVAQPIGFSHLTAPDRT
jgi:hypothetical protein